MRFWPSQRQAGVDDGAFMAALRVAPAGFPRARVRRTLCSESWPGVLYVGARRRLRFRGPVVALCALGLSLPIAAYGGSAWTIDRTPSDGGFSQLAAVSCVSVRWCAAVGYGSGLPRFDAIAEIWNGSRWTITSIP